MKPYENRMLIVTCVIAGITAVYAYFAWGQWNAMKASNKITRDGLVTVQRAFIYNSGLAFKAGDRPPGIDPSIPIAGLIFHFENSGETPASEVVATTNVCMQQGSDIDDGFDYRDLRHDRYRFNLIAPHSTVNTVYPLNADQIDAVMKFKTSLFVWGWVRYRDVFNNPHTTEFCKKYVGFTKRSSTTDFADFHFLFDQCPKHNCADKGCQRKWGTDWTIQCENIDTSAE